MSVSGEGGVRAARHGWRRWLDDSPVLVAFCASLLLSLIAVLGVVTIAKDAAFYIDIAQQVGEQGWQVASERFNWPGLIYLLSASHMFLGLPLEWAAYLWCALFMAGACALWVACIRRVHPPLAPWAVLIALSVPAFNDFRDDILREFGFWFFTALACWALLVWRQREGFLRAALVHASILAAMIFRLEAALLYAAFALWVVGGVGNNAGRRRLLQFALWPLILAGIGLIYLSLSAEAPRRLEYYLALLNPQRILAVYNQMAETLAEAAFAKYLHDDAGVLLLLLVLSTCAYFYAASCGVLAFIFLHPRAWSAVAVYWRDYRPFALAFLTYLGVLLIFFVQKGFLNSRYVSYLHWLSLPLLSWAMLRFYQAFPRLGKLMVGLLLLTMLANVVSTSAKKTHYLEVAQWLSEHVEQPEQVYFQDGRFAYYAGFGYRPSRLDFVDAMSDAERENYRYFVIEMKPDHPWLVAWLAKNGGEIVARFANRKQQTVLVIAPKDCVAPHVCWHSLSAVAPALEP